MYPAGTAGPPVDKSYPPWHPLTPLTTEVQGPLLRGENMALTQVGWLDHGGKVYGLHDLGAGDVRDLDASPLFLQLGDFKLEDGQLVLVDL
jgi:hypothetical protein